MAKRVFVLSLPIAAALFGGPSAKPKAVALFTNLLRADGTFLSSSL